MSLKTQGFIQLFRIRNFTLLWVAQLISVIGDWVLTAALLVFVYKLTGEKVTVGKMIIFEALPVLLFGYPAGMIADCLNRRRVMIFSDLARAGLVLLLLFVRTAESIWIVYFVAFFCGLFSLFFRPARTASIPNIVPKELLMTANSAATFNETVGMLIGPVIGGALGYSFIRTACILDSATFLFSAIALMFTVIPQGKSSMPRRLSELGRESVDGIGFVIRSRTLRSLLLILGLMAVAVGAYNVLEVIFAMDDLKLSGGEFGMLLSAAAMGMFVGSLIAGSISRRFSPAIFLSTGVFGVGLTMIWFSQTHIIHTALMALFMMGVCNAAAIIGCSTLFQLCTPNRLQARAIAMFWTLYSAINLTATYVSTVAADFYSVRGVLMLCGILASLGGILSVAIIPREDLAYESSVPESCKVLAEERM
ncbi:MAG: MFS transporter [Armatimonadota bacterium]|nr:MFS transporter [Armatimonadota bacterium]